MAGGAVLVVEAPAAKRLRRGEHAVQHRAGRLLSNRERRPTRHYAGLLSQAAHRRARKHQSHTPYRQQPVHPSSPQLEIV